MGVVAPYVLTEAQGIPLTAVSWTYDGQPGTGSSALGVALHVWNTPGLHTLRAVASASNGRTAEATLSLFAVSQPLAGGLAHSCALTASRSAKCWGNGNPGDLGNGSVASSAVPVDVTGLSGLLGLAAGDGHSCALKGDGSVACWGDNIEGQLGNASTFHGSANPTPKLVDGLGGVVALAAGRYHTCALKADGSVVCFGRNTSNELGTAAPAVQSVAPVAVAGLNNAVAIAAGGGYFTCALKADATVACWGSNESGELGNNTAALKQTGTPQTVMTEQGAVLGNVLVLRSGQSHSCAIVADGQNSVYCWGHNGYTQVSPVASSHYGAVKVAGVSNALMLSTTAFSTCVVDTSFATRCWGSNGYGEVNGSGTPAGNIASPVAIAGLQGSASPDYLAGGNEFMCALRADGSASCLGRGGNGQIGNGLSVDAPTLRGVSAAAGTFWRWLGAAQ
jgi:alpha-tubulin suppressor-like RCC1 family protein